MSIKAFLFDFDGVIIDSERILYQTWQEIFERYDLDFPLDRWTNHVGSETSYYPEEDLHAHFPDVSVEAILKLYDRNLDTRIQESPVLPGIFPLLDYAKERNIGCAIVSSSPREWIDAHSAGRNILPYMAKIITRECVERVKPAPDLYLKAAEEFGARPDETLVFEDSLNGLRSAKSAGAYCVITGSCFFDHFDYSAADLILRRADELPPAEIMRIIETMRAETL